MNEEEQATIPIEQSVEKQVNAQEIIGRLEKKQEGKYVFSESLQLECVYGIDPEKEMTVSGWSCFLIPQTIPSKIEIILNNNQKLSGESLNKVLPISEIKVVNVDERSYSINRDAWGNPSIYTKKEKPELESETNTNFKETLQKATILWEAAVQGEQEVKNRIKELYGDETLSIITNLLSTLEQYPEIQRELYWSEKIDLWDIAYRGKTVSNAIKILRGENGGTRLPHRLKDTDALKKCEDVIKKIINNQSLEDSDRYFIDAIKINSIAISKSIRDGSTHQINDFTRRYSMANIAENLICRELVGWDTYEQHQEDFQNFTSTLEKSGYSIPEWFEPYKGNEFTWGFALDGTIANAAGNYFLDSASFNQNDIAYVLNHERGHKLESIAKDLGLKKRITLEKERGEYKLEKYTESFTESLALLMGNNGDVNSAINENKDSTVSYKNGVDQLLKILLEINQFADDNLMASKLMIDGFKNLSQGESSSQTEIVRFFYDANVSKKQGSFDELMKPYLDKNMIKTRWTDNSEQKTEPNASKIKEIIKTTISRVLHENLSDLEKKEFLSDPKKFNEQKESKMKLLLKWPSLIIGTRSNPLTQRVFTTIKENPEASKQFQEFLNFNYKQYALALRTWVDTGKKQSIR